MRKTANSTHVEGYLYDQHLELKETGPQSKNPGTQYIRGTIDIATDDEMLNIVPVNFTYVAPTYNSDPPRLNPTFSILKSILDGSVGTYVKHGADRAAKINVDGEIALNDFPSDRSGEVEMVSQIRNEGRFIHSQNTFTAKRNSFKADMIITKTRLIEGNLDFGRKDKVAVEGYIFSSWHQDLLPVTFSIYTEKGMQYFLGLEVSETKPLFTQVGGEHVNTTVMIKKTVENLIGEPTVEETPVSQKDFVITSLVPVNYEWDDEASITVEELNTKKAARAEMLANTKANWLARRQAQNGGHLNTSASTMSTSFAAAASIPSGTFDF